MAVVSGFKGMGLTGDGFVEVDERGEGAGGRCLSLVFLGGAGFVGLVWGLRGLAFCFSGLLLLLRGGARVSLSRCRCGVWGERGRGSVGSGRCSSNSFSSAGRS